MKKVILLLLLILPVAIVAASFAIAGAIGRGIMYVEVEQVYLTRDAAVQAEFYQIYRGRQNGYVLTAQVGRDYEFGKFFTVSPAKAKFADLDFPSSNPAAVSVEDGKLRVKQNMRSSDNKEIRIDVKYGDTEFFSVYVQIEPDNGRFDYFGYDYGLLERSVSNAKWPDPYSDVKVSDSCGVNTNLGYLIIDRSRIPGGAGVIPDIGALLRDGLDTAPYNLLYYDEGNVNWVDFANSLTVASNDEAVLRLTPTGRNGDGVDVLDAHIMSLGEVELTIKTSWLDKHFETAVRISIVEN